MSQKPLKLNLSALSAVYATTDQNGVYSVDQTIIDGTTIAHNKKRGVLYGMFLSKSAAIARACEQVEAYVDTGVAQTNTVQFSGNAGTGEFKIEFISIYGKKLVFEVHHWMLLEEN